MLLSYFDLLGTPLRSEAYGCVFAEHEAESKSAPLLIILCYLHEMNVVERIVSQGIFLGRLKYLIHDHLLRRTGIARSITQVYSSHLPAAKARVHLWWQCFILVR